MKARRVCPLFALALLATTCLATATAAGTAPRQHILFDADWRFRQDPLPKSVADGGFQWRSQPAKVSSLDVASTTDLDPAAWRSVRIGQDVFRQRPGFAWFTTDLGPVAVKPNLVLHFESVDDNGVVFVNGKRLVKHSGWNDPFDVPLSDAVTPRGPNIVTVLVENTYGPGGIAGSVSLRTINPLASAEQKPAFDDRGWPKVHLPHDYVVYGPFDQSADNSHGSHPVSPAWYRKTFMMPSAYRSKSVSIDFDGVFRASDVYLNGHKLGHWESGYIGFRYDLAPYANFGGSNVLAVRVDPRRSEGWWYEGGGIYRHVWLTVTDPVHVAPDGVFVRSDVERLPGLAADDAKIDVATSVLNATTSAQKCRVFSEIISPSGASVGSATTALEVRPNTSAKCEQITRVMRPILWSIETPHLYRLESTVYLGSKIVDRVVTPFGVRTIRFDKNLGFFLNGKPVKLQGTCNHQDHAGVGIAMPDSLLEWRIKKLKEMGANAYRCSHNPPAAELLDACDRLGMVVMDETRHLGDTESPKTARGTLATDLSELKAMLMRDRNHPSIIMWSLANEESLQGDKEGGDIYAAMKKQVKLLDPDRPVSSAMNGGWGSGISLVEDLLGINYAPNVYDRMHRRMPEIPMFGSETASALSTRGEYANDRARGAMSAYDVNAPGWGSTAEGAWTPLAQRSFMAGGFVWTGFDYRGEPTPYGWPNVSSQFGIMDTCGFPKDSYYYYKAWWGHDPVVHLLPHWNWPGKEGQPIDVWVHGNTDEVELLLNGQSLGTKPMPRFGHLQWSVPYQPGVLMAKGVRNGKVIATDRVETTGAPAAIRLVTDRTTLDANDEDLTEVRVEIVDAMGRVVPSADNLVHFSLAGAGLVAGVGNGDPASHEADKASLRHAFHGLCAVLVQDRGRGQITLTATAPGLKTATCRFFATLK